MLTFAALTGSKYLEFLLKHKQPTPVSSWALDEAYTAGLMYPTRAISRAAPRPTENDADKVSGVVHKQTNNESEDVMVLQRWNGKLIAEQFDLPDMEVEIERAVEQVEKAIDAKERIMEKRLEQEKATTEHPDQRAKDILPDHILEKIQDEAEHIAEKAKEGVKEVEKH
jgi:hypothetical protein